MHIGKVKFGIAFLALILVPSAYAKENEIEFVCCSWHHNRSAGYNEFQAGVVYRRETSGRWGMVGGTFRNSNDKQSFLIAGTYSYPVTDWLEVGLTFGGVTGYSLPIMPAAIPDIKAGPVRIYVVPGVVYVLGITVAKW